MKKLGAVFLMLSTLLFARFANDLQKIEPKLILSGALNKEIKGLYFNKDTFLVYSNTQAVLRNIKNGSINIIHKKYISKALFYKGKIYLYLSGENRLHIYPANKNEEENELILKHSPHDFLIVNGYMYVLFYDNLEVYSLNSGKEINKIELGFSGHKMFNTYNKNIYVIKQYNTYADIFKNSVLLNKVEYKDSFLNINVLNNIIFLATTTNSDTTFKILELQTLKQLHKFKLEKKAVSAQISKNGRYILYTTGDDKKIYLFDIMKQKTVSYIDIKYSKAKIVLSNNNRYLGVYYPEGIYDIYSTENIENFMPIEEKKPVIEEIENKPVTKHVTKNSNKKPFLQINASVVEGFAPLKVTFTINTNKDDNIIGYYVNFGDSEMLKSGRPPFRLSHIYRKPGIYEALIAVKNNNGYITQKTIRVIVKEETFQDFKKTYGY